MSPTPAELLREMDAKATKGPWRSYVRRAEDRGVGEAPVHLGAPFVQHTVAEVMGAVDGQTMATLRNALPLLAAYAEAAEAMREPDPMSTMTLAEHTLAVHRRCEAYDAARDALVRAMQEGR